MDYNAHFSNTNNNIVWVITPRRVCMRLSHTKYVFMSKTDCGMSIFRWLKNKHFVEEQINSNWKKIKLKNKRREITVQAFQMTL